MILLLIAPFGPTFAAAAEVSTNSGAIWTSIISIVVGALIAILAEPIRRWFFRPRLAIAFQPGVDCIARTPIRNGANGVLMGEALYLRVRVTNSSFFTARKCRVYLTNIEERDADETFSTNLQGDSLQLGWACRTNPAERFTALDLPKGVNQFVDVLHTYSFHDGIFTPDVEFVPSGYSATVRKPGVYRLTILATGDDVAPATGRLLFTWTGKWDEIVAVASR